METLTNFVERRRKMLIVMLALVMMLVMNGFSFASSISFDASTMIDQINIWVPVFLPILGIGLGITIAIALIERVGKGILDAFK